MKLRDALGSDWFDKLSPFIKSEDFKKIHIKLGEESQLVNSVLVPSLDVLFQPFKLCAWDKLSVVILNDHPYKDVKNNDGLAFSTKDWGTTLSREQKAFCEGIEGEIYDGFNIKVRHHLDYLAQQGVLLLNAALTMSFAEDKWEIHEELWKPFIRYVLHTIIEHNTGVVFILVGKNVRDYANIILPSQNYVLTCTHPRDATHFAQTWDAGGVFNITNRILKQNNNTQIIW